MLLYRRRPQERQMITVVRESAKAPMIAGHSRSMSPFILGAGTSAPRQLSGSATGVSQGLIRSNESVVKNWVERKYKVRW